MSLRTNAAFMDYLEQCCLEGSAYGDQFVHVSADHRNRYNRLIKRKNAKMWERTTFMATPEILAGIHKWRFDTQAAVAKKLTS